MSIANSKKEAQKIAAKSMAIQMKIGESFARAIRRIFTRMANDFQATYTDTRQVLNLTSYKPDIIALLRDYYSRTAKIFKNNIRKGLKLSSDELDKKIDSQLAVFVKGHSMAQSDIIITTLQKNLVQDLNDVMIEAAAEGIVLDKSVVAKNTRDKFLKKSKNRAETIAQTEVGTASGYSTQTEAQVLKQHENLEVKKIWVSMLDDVTRISHVFADGQIQNMDDPFIVGGEALQYPKDPNGSIENTINCFDKETEVLTNEGYKYFKDLKGDEKIATFNIDTKEIEYADINKIIKQDYDDYMIWFKNESMDFMMTPNHRVFILNGKPYGIKNIEFKEVLACNIKKKDFIPKSFIWNVPKVDTIKIDQEYNSEDFMEFLGWYLSEGNVLYADTGTYKTKSGNKLRKANWQIAISQDNIKNSEKYKRIVSICKKLFKKVWLGKGKIYIPNQELALYLKGIGKSYEKSIPAIFKNLHKEALQRFLDSYCLGDGYILKNKINHTPKRMFFTSSKKMADDIAELIIKCGKNPSFRLDKAKKIKFKNGIYDIKHPCYWIFENNRKYYCITKINRIKYKGLVYCVEVSKNGTLNVRRNNKTSWFGNCRCERVFLTK